MLPHGIDQGLNQVATPDHQAASVELHPDAYEQTGLLEWRQCIAAISAAGGNLFAGLCRFYWPSPDIVMSLCTKKQRSPIARIQIDLRIVSSAYILVVLKVWPVHHLGCNAATALGLVSEYLYNPPFGIQSSHRSSSR